MKRYNCHESLIILELKGRHQTCSICRMVMTDHYTETLGQEYFAVRP